MIDLECSNEVVISIILATSVTLILIVGIIYSNCSALFLVSMYCFIVLMAIIIFNILQ